MSFTESGFVVIDKPQGVTSHDVVAKVRKTLGTRKVGHAGTLDPMATGVLVIGVNQATRFLDYIVSGSKEYEATVRLGMNTISDDKDGEVISTFDASPLSEDQIAKSFAKNVGKISQLPSKVSAKKVQGKRAHALVRDGVEFELQPRDVEISEIEIHSITKIDKFVDVDVRVKCSAGTYIRAIARDVGADLGVGGHLISLRRTLVAPFELAVAQTLDEPLILIDIYSTVSKALATLEVNSDIAERITFGKPLDKKLDISNQPTALTFKNQVLAIVHRNSSNEIEYRAVFANGLDLELQD